MKQYGISFHSDIARIWCLAHVVNIVVQTILTELDEAEDPDNLNWFDINKHLPAHYDVDQDEDLQEMEAEVLEDDTVDGTTKINEVLGDELPKDVASLSVVKRVSWCNSTKVAIHWL